MVCRLAERQGRHRRAAPVEHLVRGKHAAILRSRGAVEPLRSPQDGFHPQAGAVRVPNSLQLFQVHVREEPIHFNAGRVARLDGSRQPLSTGPFCSGVYGPVSSRRIWRLLRYSTNAELVYSVPLSVRNARGTPMSATNHCKLTKLKLLKKIVKTVL